LLLDEDETVLYERRYGPHGHSEGQSILRFPIARAEPGPAPP
jgi:hypothetical protein